jgi:N-acetylglucosaminyldiphosphoundecaprenol N-acetyl-beta-D-mannosaminyltransferase
MATQVLPKYGLDPLPAYGLRTARVFGTTIHRVTMAQTMQLVQQAIEHRERLRIGVVNAAKLLNMRHDERLREDVSSSDLVLADGMPVVWVSKLFGAALPERVAGIDLMMEIFRLGNERSYRVFCLGAKRAVLDTVISRLRLEYPGVNVVGSRDGYFPESESANVAHEIASARPDVLLVAMTSPKKENFLGTFGAEMGVPVCHGVGGSFDVFSGLVKRAPELWQKLGIEWLYRVKQEPRRLWKRYLVTNTQFVLLLAAELFRIYGKLALNSVLMVRK